MRNKGLWIITLILTAMATAARVLRLPVAAGDGMGLTRIDYPLLLVLAAAVAVLLAWGHVKKSERIAPVSDGAGAVAAAGGLFGLLMLGSAAWEAYNWMANGETPAPNAAIANSVDRVALITSLLCGVVGGVFLLAQFIAWRRGANAPLSAAGAGVTGVVGALAGVTVVVLAVKTWRESVAQLVSSRGKQTAMLGMLLGVAVGVALTVAFIRWLLRGERRTGWLWLLPTLWMFARLLRYDVCYATSVDIAPAVYEFLTYGVSALFILSAAQYFSGVATPSRWLRGLSAATAALTLAATLSRLVLWGLGEMLAVAYCPLPGVADVGLGLFALVLTAALPVEPAEVPVAE